MKGLILSIAILFTLMYLGYLVLRATGPDRLEYFVENKLPVLAACLGATITIITIIVAIF